MILRNSIKRFIDDSTRFGMMKAFVGFLDHAINKFFFFDVLYVIVLDRHDSPPFTPKEPQRLSARLATRSDIERMSAEERWEIGQPAEDAFNDGDQCLLSFVDGNLAGYTWIHTRGMPQFLPGLQLATPLDYLYNYKGFTLPEYRGYGLQPYRHHEVMAHTSWRSFRGLIGYVRYTNWASQLGQKKAGYRKIGSLWLLGWKSTYLCFRSPSLKRLGIRRLSTPHHSIGTAL